MKNPFSYEKQGLSEWNEMQGDSAYIPTGYGDLWVKPNGKNYSLVMAYFRYHKRITIRECIGNKEEAMWQGLRWLDGVANGLVPKEHKIRKKIDNEQTKLCRSVSHLWQ